MPVVERFELRRRLDGHVYRFTKTGRADGILGFLRADGEHWIIWDDDLGWHAFDFGTLEITGRLWSVLPRDQSYHAPPQGEWVSKKADKTWVYELVHIALCA